MTIKLYIISRKFTETIFRSIWLNKITLFLECYPFQPQKFNVLCFNFLDNPLICDCDLRWYRDWLKELRHRDDDDIIQKKHILCLMEEEHRFLQFYLSFIVILESVTHLKLNVSFMRLRMYIRHILNSF